MSGEKLTTEMALRALSFGSVIKIGDSWIEFLTRGVVRRWVVFRGDSYEQVLRSVILHQPLVVVNDIMEKIREYHFTADGDVPVMPAKRGSEEDELSLFVEHIAWLKERGFDDLVFEAGASTDEHAVAVFRFGNECKISHTFPLSLHTRYRVANQAVELLAEAFVHELLMRFDELVAPAKKKLAAASATPPVRNKKRNLARANEADSLN